MLIFSVIVLAIAGQMASARGVDPKADAEAAVRDRPVTRQNDPGEG